MHRERERERERVKEREKKRGPDALGFYNLSILKLHSITCIRTYYETSLMASDMHAGTHAHTRASIIDHRTYGCMDLRTEKNCKSRNKPTLKYVAERKK